MTNNYEFARAARLVQDAFRDSGVFVRADRGAILEQEEVRTNGQKYLVLAAGIGRQDSEFYFRHARNRQDALRDYPLRLRGGGLADILLCMRPVGSDEPLGATETRTSFSPQETRLSHVAIKAAHLRVYRLPENPLHLQSLRLEYDPQRMGTPPTEAWLRVWAEIAQDNPAHAVIHLHVNSGEEASWATTPRRPAHQRDEDLRLGIGFPNPLIAVLSLACWYRRTCLLRGVAT